MITNRELQQIEMALRCMVLHKINGDSYIPLNNVLLLLECFADNSGEEKENSPDK